MTRSSSASTTPSSCGLAALAVEHAVRVATSATLVANRNPGHPGDRRPSPITFEVVMAGMIVGSSSPCRWGSSRNGAARDSTALVGSTVFGPPSPTSSLRCSDPALRDRAGVVPVRGVHLDAVLPRPRRLVQAARAAGVRSASRSPAVSPARSRCAGRDDELQLRGRRGRRADARPPSSASMR